VVGRRNVRDLIQQIIATASDRVEYSAKDISAEAVGRTTARKHVTGMMKAASVVDALWKPKSHRHGFAIRA